ncbi:MAG: hypothetical protein FJW20_24460 [Acidimicrobiia bacterium]|nr:hypothetical protein [Acidimicrobiia bacterium]
MSYANRSVWLGIFSLLFILRNELAAAETVAFAGGGLALGGGVAGVFIARKLRRYYRRMRLLRRILS